MAAFALKQFTALIYLAMTSDILSFFQENWHAAIDAPTEFADALEEAWSTAKADHPGVVLLPERFVRVLAQRLPPDSDPVAELQKLSISDLYLCAAVLDGDSTAYISLDDKLRTAAQRASRRFNACDDDVNELGQILFEHLLVATSKRRARLHEYAGKGSLERWLQAVATRSKLNAMRGVKREVLIDDGAIFDALVPDGQTPAIEPSKDQYRQALKNAFSTALEELSDRDKALLRMAYLDRVNLAGLGRAFGLSRATAHRRLADARDNLGKGIERCLGRELSLGHSIAPEQLASIRRLVQSQISISLGRILAS